MTVLDDGWFEVGVDGGPVRRCRLEHDGAEGSVVVVDGTSHPVVVAAAGASVLVGVSGTSWRLDRATDRGVAESASGGSGDGVVRSPMPGTVIAVNVAPGDAVVAGAVVAIVEAMKMEHALRAPSDGIVAEVHAVAGTTVALDQPLVRIDAAD